ncbi:MAG TPA: calcium-binding protein [Solirubrobacterales bacterium]|nr:calcium-binding protein [Solirubrobacterales bacterium]
MSGSAAAADTTPTCAEGPTTVEGTTYGTPCSDTIVAPAGVEDVKGGGGNDTIVPAPITASAPCPESCLFLGVGSQTFEGGPGDDVVFGERGNDILRGGGGNDQLFGGIGDDLLEGGPGNDRLSGGFGADSIDGQEGDDYVRGDGTIDRIYDTGGGTDTLSFSTGITPGFNDPVSVANFPPAGGERGLELELGVGGENADNGVAPNGGGVDEVEVGAFETIVGTPFSDRIVGTTAAETIYGGGGADALEGGGGADTLVGGADGDYCQGSGATTSGCEAGIAIRETGKVSVGFMTPPEATPYAQLYLVGSSGNDSVTAAYQPGPPESVSFKLTAGTFETPSGGGCSVSSTEATCTPSVPLDSVVVAGMNGTDVIKAETFPATVGLVMTGGEGSDTVTGGQESEDAIADGPGSGSDVLSALGRDDVLFHNGGADQLLGGDGNDLFLSNSICDGQAIQGGSGRNNASWTKFGEGVEVNLESGVAGRLAAGSTPECGVETPDSLQEVQDLEGSRFGDSFYGDGGMNQLLGHLGGDSYFAGAGEDSILANSGDSDPTVDCGADADTALIDFPPFVDGPPVECEQVIEAAPNSFRIPTQLPPPPLAEGTSPVTKPPVVKPPRDRRSPQTRLTSHPPALLFAHRKWRQVAFRFASSEAGSSFRCKLDAKPYMACTSPRRYHVKIGRHAFRVFAIDDAGNRDRTPVLLRFRVRSR